MTGVPASGIDGQLGIFAQTSSFQSTTNDVEVTGSFKVSGSIDISNGSLTSVGDFTLDSGGDIVLDADGTDIVLKDGGTEFGSFKRASSDFVIKSATADKDIIFKGSDDGVTTTAMTLDMSEGGNVILGANISGSSVSTGSFGHTETSTIKLGDTFITGSDQLASVGNSGSSGTDGNSGNSGDSGSTGTDGNSGNSGNSGDSGSSGTGGTSANSGNSGMSDGNAGSPGAFFASDTDTGFYRPASNAIGFSGGGDENFRMGSGGTFHAEADVIAYSSTVGSDKRLKENINPLKYGLEELLKIRPVEFDWKINDNKHDVGVIAQELEDVIPELIIKSEAIGKTQKYLQENYPDTDYDTKLSVDYSRLTVVLVNAIKEQQEQIEDMKERLEYLESNV